MTGTTNGHRVGFDYFAVEPRLQPLFFVASDVVKPAWYLCQMYSAAQDYETAIALLAQASNDSSVDVARAVVRVREISKTLAAYANMVSGIYEHCLRPLLDDENQAPGFGGGNTVLVHADESLSNVHITYRSDLKRVLAAAGCGAPIADRFADDALDLLWEVTAFIRRMRRLCEGDNANTPSLAVQLTQIVSPWLPASFHLLYHLGEFEGTLVGARNPGVLGWSLAVLSEIDASELQNRGAQS